MITIPINGLIIFLFKSTAPKTVTTENEQIASNRTARQNTNSEDDDTEDDDEVQNRIVFLLIKLIF